MYLQERLESLNSVGVLEHLRLFSMDGEDKNAEVCLVLYEEISTADVMRLYEQVGKCCREFGISQAVIQIRYEVTMTDETVD